MRPSFFLCWLTWMALSDSLRAELVSLVRFSGIEGSSGAPGFEKWSRFSGWTWEMGRDGELWQGELDLPVDAATPGIAMAIFEGRAIPEVTLVFFVSDEPRWQIRLREVTLMQFNLDGDRERVEGAMSSIRFRFEEMMQAVVFSEEDLAETVGAEGDFENQMCRLFDLRAVDYDLDFLPNIDDPDDDNDSLSDVLEEEAGLNPLLDDADQDADGDGQSNRIEAIAGTRVFDPGSRWKIAKLEKGEMATRVSWVARAGRTYRVFSTIDLGAGNWREFTAGPIPTGNDKVVSVDIPNDGQSQFFKVSVELP